ncbi:MAG: hypothetical protein P1V18_05370 [Candidatus Gracilibacteria bacterium]|nr:hypothetical protein [Candidatus Gracilibacteria bacterium]
MQKSFFTALKVFLFIIGSVFFIVLYRFFTAPSLPETEIIQRPFVPEVEKIVVEEFESQREEKVIQLEPIPGISDPLVAEFLRDQGHESLCPQEGFRNIWDESDNRILGGYQCTYKGEKLGALHSDDCKENFQDEFVRRKYNIVNECLYADGELVSETPLRHALFAGDFGGPEYNIEGLNLFTSEILFEWHRFIRDNHLYVLISGNAGCGGCLWNGPYLVIELDTGEVQKKYYDFPYNPYVSFSPDGDKMISISMSDQYTFNVDDQKLFLLDIPTGVTQEIYTVPSDQSLIGIDVFPFFVLDAIIWDSNDEVRIAQIKKTENTDEYVRGSADMKDPSEADFYKRYTFLGEPVQVDSR